MYSQYVLSIKALRELDAYGNFDPVFAPFPAHFSRVSRPSTHPHTYTHTHARAPVYNMIYAVPVPVPVSDADDWCACDPDAVMLSCCLWVVGACDPILCPILSLFFFRSGVILDIVCGPVREC